jgi:hypothetical protein
MQWFPALEAIAQRPALAPGQLDQERLPAAGGAGPVPTTPRRYPACAVWRERALRRIERERPALV